ncbi:glycine betaine-specific corrinoid protein MtgC [Acetobacterium tundrae]|uniref:Dimethylamine corrinoid protein 3 n=1 Tax=Acetobacterium tundrae TaxID=132932 RepID=A0ABR6WQW9_9FIRM|nr:corrinoid protein [Acetobacterium tundrae]MBC3798522.1 dimethylamine corrinoid protein 3 [Acetobacterium tundrae]
MSTIFEEIKACIIDGDDELAVELAEKVIAEKINPVDAVHQGFIKGIEEVGAAWTSGEAFLPDVMMAADAMKAGMDVLEPALANCDKGDASDNKGSIVIGTVKGDIHDIGKNILSALLTAAKFKVYDIGTDQSPENFVKKADEVGAYVLAASALLTTTMKSQKEIVDYLEENNIRDKYYLIVGGGPTSQHWADEIGADGWAETTEEAIKVISNLMVNKPIED